MDQRQAVSLWIAGCIVSLLTGIGLGYWVAVSVERQPFYQTTKIGWGDIEYVCVVDTRTGKIVRMANAIDARREAKEHERPTPPALQTRPPEGLPLTMSLEEFDAATEAASKQVRLQQTTDIPRQTPQPQPKLGREATPEEVAAAFAQIKPMPLQPNAPEWTQYVWIGGVLGVLVGVFLVSSWFIERACDRAANAAKHTTPTAADDCVSRSAENASPECPMTQRASAEAADSETNFDQVKWQDESVTVDTTRKASPIQLSTKYCVLLTVGIVTTVLAQLLSLGRQSFEVVAFDALTQPICYFLCLALVAGIIAGVARMKKLWFPALAWLFCVAGLFDIVGRGVCEFVLRPKIDSVIHELNLEDMRPGHASTDARHPVAPKTPARSFAGMAASPNKQGVSVRHILVQYKGSDRASSRISRTKEEALHRMQECLARLMQGEEFEVLAKLYSDCPSAPFGGDLGSFTAGTTVLSFEQAAFGCEVGQFTGIVETQCGYHIIQRYE